MQDIDYFYSTGDLKMVVGSHVMYVIHNPIITFLSQLWGSPSSRVTP